MIRGLHPWRWIVVDESSGPMQTISDGVIQVTAGGSIRDGFG